MAETKRLVSPVFPEDVRETLAELRSVDPARNLAERWALLAELRPDIVERRLGFVPMVAEHGWAVIALPNDGFAYTIGLKYNFDHPELLIVAPNLSPQDIRQLLNAVGLYVSLGNRILPGEPVDLTDFGVSLTFAAYSNDVFERYATGYLASFERFFADVDHASGDTLPVLWAELVLLRTRAKAKKAAPKKAAPKKAAPKKAAPKKAAPKKAAPKKAALKKATPKKAAPKKAAPKKAAPKKAAPKKAAPKKAAPKKAAPKKAAPKKAAPKKAAPKKSPKKR